MNGQVSTSWRPTLQYFLNKEDGLLELLRCKYLFVHCKRGTEQLEARGMRDVSGLVVRGCCVLLFYFQEANSSQGEEDLCSR